MNPPRPSLLLALATLILPNLNANSEAWHNIAAADLKLMGDYEGKWVDPPEHHYYYGNPMIAAQVINTGPERYRIVLMQELNRRATTYVETTANADGESISFVEGDWSGEITPDGFNGSVVQGDNTIHFTMERANRPSPTLGMAPPENAIILFDGSNFDAWRHPDDREVTWHMLEDGTMEVSKRDNNANPPTGGDIVTRDNFTDLTLHIEFRYPVEPERHSQDRGNSGVFLQDTYEVQILNSYGLNGLWNEAGALYKVLPPQVNAAYPPLEWQTYDISYRAPRFNGDAKTENARITVHHNGILIHNDVEIPYATVHAALGRNNEPKNPAPIRLQDHSNPIQFRNIWLIDQAE